MINANGKNFQQWFQLGVNAEIGVGNFLEYVIQIIYSSILSPGDVAIDGGANRGMHSIPMASVVGENGLVIGFEAIPKLASDLSNKLTENRIENVLIRSVAIGDKTGFVEFHYVIDCDYRSGIKEQHGIPENFKGSAVKISVPLSTLDREVDGEKRVRFIKLDLEGGEYHALRGAERIMNMDKPLIVFENGRETSAKVYGYQRSDWFALFHDREYEVYDLFGRRFAVEDWENYDRDKSFIPWYFIAASRDSDKKFISDNLPHLIGVLATALTRHSQSKK